MKSVSRLLLNDNDEIDLPTVVVLFGTASIGGAVIPALGISLSLTAITLGVYVLRAVPERRRVTQVGLLVSVVGLLLGGISLAFLLNATRNHAGADTSWGLQDWTPLAPRAVLPPSASHH